MLDLSFYSKKSELEMLKYLFVEALSSPSLVETSFLSMFLIGSIWDVVGKEHLLDIGHKVLNAQFMPISPIQGFATV